LESLLDKLQLPAEALIRTKEPVWTEKFSKKKLSREQLIQAMVDHPILMQRPILVKRTRAIIGRPPELAAKWI
jgi:arsenate reductase